MCHYHHLILSEREKLLFFLAKGCTLTYIAQKMGRNNSTIGFIKKLRHYGKKRHLKGEEECRGKSPFGSSWWLS